MGVFFKSGYEGASLPALTKAMGVNRPSLYAAFGNKEALFRRVLERYLDRMQGVVREVLQQPTSRGVVEMLLKGMVGKPGTPRQRGCLLVQGALACGESGEPIRRELTLRRAAMEQALRQRFERSVAEGDLPADANPAALAKFVAAFQQGLAVQASGGASREEMLAAVEVALRAWPT